MKQEGCIFSMNILIFYKDKAFFSLHYCGREAKGKSKTNRRRVQVPWSLRAYADISTTSVYRDQLGLWTTDVIMEVDASNGKPNSTAGY